MPSSPFRRLRTRALSVVSFCLIVFVLVSGWASSQRASKRSSNSHHSNAPRGASLPDKGGIRPEATTIVVNSTSDVADGGDGLCTLREAITAANNNVASGVVAGECAAGSSSGTDTIDLTALTGTINLTAALPGLTSNMTINGPGSGQLTVRRNTGGDYRIFFVSSGTIAISELTIANGKAPDGSAADGGGILNNATLTLSDVVVTGCHAGNAGSVFTNGGSGGGIASSGTLTMSNCTVSTNVAGTGAGNGLGGDGGGISVSGTLTMRACTVTNNQSGASGGVGSNPGNGGGLKISGTVTLDQITFSNNTAPLVGGAVAFFSGYTIVRNSTISGNSAAGGGGIGVLGNPGTDLILENTTITANTSGSTSSVGIAGSGIANPGASVFIRNTIVAGNIGQSDVTGGYLTAGHNLIGNADNSSGFTNGSNGDQIGSGGVPLNAQLGPLANNGGPTLTHALLSNSPALDAGDNCVTQATHCNDANIPQLLTDQRGTVFNRLVDGPDPDSTATVDIGAYETQVAVTDIANTSTFEDTQVLVPFDGGDTSNITSVTATSDNFTVVPNDTAHLSVAITGSTGIVTIIPATNANGTANITVTVNRSGGGSDVRTFMLTVNPVNDAPSFTKGANQTVNEDAGAQTVNNWATAISPGPADESGQTVTFQITGNTNAGLFSVAPAISSSGTLTYTPAPDANGSATITANLKDNGGTASGGVDTSAPQSLTITVSPVNDPPSFTKGADQIVYNTAGAQTVANWATNISAGPANESTQTVSFQVTGNTNPGLFTAGPAIGSTGTLTYTPSSSAGGAATITIVAKDNAGTANGGVDTSAAQSFTITVNPAGGFISFASSSSNTTENSGSMIVNVTRTGDTVLPVTVKYATNGDSGLPCSAVTGVASPKCDFTAALGTLNFGIGQTSKTITILIGQDSFVEGPETITVTLLSPTGGSALGTPASTSITVADDASEPSTNIIDDPNQFVRMHYHDFLNREGDQSGLDFWTGQMTNCGSPDLTFCRVNVSGAFFLSIEFQQTGYLVERMYKTAYGDAIGTSTLGGAHQVFVPVVRANEFLADTQRVGRGVVVLQPGWEQVLENNKQAYALEFVQTSRFVTALPTTMTPTQFVDRLNQNAGNVLSPNERTTAINTFGIAADTTNVGNRAQVLRQIAEDQDLYKAEFNRAFVLTQYFGYLRRNPNDLPDSDYTGYEFWLTKLNQFNGDYIAAEMVKAFISSGEYRQRFGQ
jgi:CSLREA domain-containing protein